MAIAKTVEDCLQQLRVPYTVVSHSRSISSKDTASAAAVPVEQIAKAVVLAVGNHYVMAVLPGDRHVDLHGLSDKLGGKVALADEDRIAPVFSDCEPGAIPPIGTAYGMETIVDNRLIGQKEVCFIGGDHEELICMDGEEFFHLLQDAEYAQISH